MRIYSTLSEIIGTGNVDFGSLYKNYKKSTDVPRGCSPGKGFVGTFGRAHPSSCQIICEKISQGGLQRIYKKTLPVGLPGFLHLFIFRNLYGGKYFVDVCKMSLFLRKAVLLPCILQRNPDRVRRWPLPERGAFVSDPCLPALQGDWKLGLGQ